MILAGGFWDASIGRLGRPADTRERVTANMHLYAVLPRVLDLARLDDAATGIARDMDVSIAFAVRGGPYVALDFKRGSGGARRTGLADVVLFFPSCRHLNRMFGGEKATPIPLWGLHRFRDLQRFTKLSDRLTQYLKPSDDDMADPCFRKRHVELSLLVGLAACREVADLDPRAQRVATALHDGTIQYSVGEEGPHVTAKVEHGTISVAPGRVPDPTTTIALRDLDFAVALIRGEVDTFAASGLGDIRLSGDLALADKFNHLFDRVGLYLK
ncbi:MAG: SCP2 sterol-binding domain-containing protein [Deltaproteobacteria bacterium]|nr:SCP2 sterol-binding domain-containing protein [Deltaproteobacteria bacterium]